MEPAPPQPSVRLGQRLALHLALFFATLLSVFGSYYWMFSGGATAHSRIIESLMFSVSLVLILGAHEMGHYVFARIHRVETTLPYFIPVPFIGFGTLGAVIRIRGPIPHRNALVDIGAAGPIAGLIFAIPITALGIGLSTVVDAPPSIFTFPGRQSLWELGRGLYEALQAWRAGTPVPAEAPQAMRLVFGDNLLTLFLQRVLVGPLPPGKDLLAHPFFLAGWFGLLVTMLNLVPIGQLDGGHLSHALFGKRAETVGRLMGLFMFGLCVFLSAGWLLWLIVTVTVIGVRHPPVVQPLEALSPSRKLICAICLVAFIVCLMPVPMTQIS